MSEVGGPLAEMSQYSCLDRLHSFRLLGVVGYPVFGAVGVRDEERALAVVAAAGAHRFAFFLPRLVTESSAPFAGVLTGPARVRSCVGGSVAGLSRVVHALLRSRGPLGG